MTDHNAKRYAVVLHSSGSGYVVRSEWAMSTRDYRDATPVCWYRRESAARRYADKLNGVE